MSRRSAAPTRHILPDPKFNDVLVTRFVNSLMFDGKKSIAFKIIYDALDIVDKKMKDNELSALDVWKKALINITPQVEVKSRRVGGANFQVPMEIRPERKVAISMRNLIIFSKKRSGHSMAEKSVTTSFRPAGQNITKPVSMTPLMSRLLFVRVITL